MTRVPPKLLQCPYPGCPGVVADGALDELVICPDCRRISARCTRLGRDGRCAALNRCRARFCRLCGEEFAPGWAQALWARDTGTPTGRIHLDPPLDRSDLADRLLCLDDYLACDRWGLRPLPLLEAGGWLWLGGPDGRYLLVDPFGDRNGVAAVALGQFAAGRLRARASGMWLAVASARHVEAVNLLALEAPPAGPALTLWQAEGDECVAGNPVLLRDSHNGPERLALWLTRGAGGPALWASPLLVTHGRQPPPRRHELQTPDGSAVPLDDSSPGAVLVEVPLPDRDALLLATHGGAWLVDLPRGGSADAPRTVQAIPLLPGRAPLLGTHDAPHAFCLSGGERGSLGTAFVADSEALWCVPFAESGPLGCFPFAEPGSVPFALVTARGRRQALALVRPRSALMFCDALGNATRLSREPHLYWITRASVHGRIAVVSGREAADGRARWFIDLLDLEEDDLSLGRAFAERLGAHPLALGRYLFAVESLDDGGTRRLWLTRRRFAPACPGHGSV